MRIIAVLLFVFVGIGSTCKKNTEECHYFIPFTNSSSGPVYVKFSLNYPDTAISDPNPLLSPEYRKVNPGETNTNAISRKSCFETVFSEEIPSGILQVFVFDAAVVESNSWDTIKKNYLISKRYQLSLQDLRNADFKINYP